MDLVCGNVFFKVPARVGARSLLIGRFPLAKYEGFSEISGHCFPRHIGPFWFTESRRGERCPASCRRTHFVSPFFPRKQLWEFTIIAQQQERTLKRQKCDRGRRPERVLPPLFWQLSFAGWGFWEIIVRNCIRPCVRPGAHSSSFGRFRLAKSGGF